MKKLSLRLITTFVLVIPLFFSCEKNEVTIDRNSLTNEILLQKAETFLEFTTHQAFEDSVKILSSLSRHQLSAWEQKRNFVSLRTMFETIIEQESAQADLEELQIMENKALLKTMKHTFSPLINEAKDMISVSLEDGVEYNLFNPVYASVLNKDGMVKIGKSLYKFGANEILQIVNGNPNEISSLMKITQNNQTENLRYYPVYSDRKLIKDSRAKIGSNERFCEKTNTPTYTDLKLRAWSRGFQSIYYDYSYGNYVSYFIEMSFTRKTWYGSINHSTESYSSDGTWRAYTHFSLPYGLYPPSGDQTYNLGQNFAGKSSSPTYTFWSANFVTNYQQDYGVAIFGSQHFTFLTMQCTNQ
jgi:hypothetical protein